MKTVMTLDELDNLYDRLEQNDFKCYDWWPTVEEIEKIIVPNPEKYIEFMIWILQTADDPETDEEKQSKILINRILRRTIKIKD